jgi:putative DNA primase/helicase
MSIDDLKRGFEAAEEILPPAEEKPKPNGAHDPSPKLTPKEYMAIKKLHELSPLDRDRQIKTSADELGCTVTTLRQLLKWFDHDRDAAEGAAAGPGRKLTIADIEPWPHTVELGSLLDDIAATVCTYVVTGTGVPETVALWTVHTHALDAAFISPRLAIRSPVRRCGKTTLLTLLGAMVARALSTANITAAALLRTVERAHPTALVDEADTFLKDSEELRGLVNAGHCRASSKVQRVVDMPEGPDVREFDVWGAMVIAAIGRLPATIEDRSIQVPMRRRRPDETVERLRLDRLDDFQHLAKKCRRWALDNLARLRRLDPSVPEALHDRAADNWRTLLAIADCAGGDWPKRARDAALALTSIEDTEATLELLLRDVRALFDPVVEDLDADPPLTGRPMRDVLFTDEILGALAQMVERPWPGFGRARKPITARAVAKLLQEVGALSNTVHRGKRGTADYRHGKGYRREDLDDAFARYLKEG